VPGVRICLMVEGQEGVTWDEWLVLARTCEAAGIPGLFRSDHYSSALSGEGRGSLDAWATLAALAARTERIRLGTMVSPVTFRHPANLSRCAVTVDHVSGGRVEVGMGVAWMELEHRANGFPFHDARTRVSLLREQVEIVVRQWTEDEFSFEGEHYRLERSRALPKPVQQPHPPLIVGGGGKPGTVVPAVRWADEYNTIFVGPERIRELRGELDAACERAGRERSLRLTLMTTAVIGADEAELRDRVRAMLERTGRPGDPDEWLSQRRGTEIVGTVEQVLELLGRYADAGLDGAYLQHLDHGDLDLVRLVGAEIVPAVS
jgi:alkanesulfonate monooxygenase SsuD/methylene tetrahydromethanopterin reductase-like flavin-dependent oxidoreductase (luciferase family)